MMKVLIKVKGIKLIAFMLFITVFTASVNMNLTVRGEENEIVYEEFKGNRSIECIIDQSDLSNFVNGGRSAFEMAIRANKPQWLNYEVSASGRNVLLKLDFDFESFEDYIKKLKELLAYNPVIIYETTGTVTYMENFTSLDLMNFFIDVLSEDGSFREFTREQLFDSGISKIQINDETFEGTDRICIGNTTTQILADSISIDTIGNDDGTYDRTIKVETNTELAGAGCGNILLRQFERVSEKIVTEGDESYPVVSVEFHAENTEDLIKKTMLALNTSSAITEEESYGKELNIEITYRENYDFTNILDKDNGKFNYSFQYPKRFKNLKLINSLTSMSENQEEDTVFEMNDGIITYNGTDGEIGLKYTKPFTLTEVDIKTDLSNKYGKLSRIITIVVPDTIPNDYDKEIKKQLKKRLKDGMAFNVYRQDNSIQYEITFSSWFEDELRQFTKKILDCKDVLNINKKGIPFFYSSVEEKMEIDKLIDGMENPEEINYIYVFPENSKIVKNRKLSDSDISNNVYRFSTNIKSDFEIRFSYFDQVKIIFWGVFVLILAVIILLSVFKIRKIIKNRKLKKNKIIF